MEVGVCFGMLCWLCGNEVFVLKERCEEEVQNKLYFFIEFIHWICSLYLFISRLFHISLHNFMAWHLIGDYLVRGSIFIIFEDIPDWQS